MRQTHINVVNGKEEKSSYRSQMVLIYKLICCHFRSSYMDEIRGLCAPELLKLKNFTFSAEKMLMSETVRDRSEWGKDHK